MTQGRPFGDLLAMPLRSGVTVAASDRGAGIKMLNMGELFRYAQIPDVEMARVDLGKFEPERVLLRPGDLMFARRSLTLEGAGKCSIVKEINEPTTWESSIIRARLDSAVAHPPYYFYFFCSPLGRQLVETIVEQVAAAGIRLSELRTLTVPLPDLREQQAIAEVLGALDDKIAANTKLNQTTAQLSAALVAERTPCVPLSGIVHHRRTSLAPDRFGDVPLAHFSFPAFDAGQVPEMTSPGAIKSSKFLIEQPCVLVSKLNPRFPRIWNVSAVPSELALASTEFLVLEGVSTSSSVLHAILSHPKFSASLKSMVAGTSGSHQRVRPDELLSTLVIDPREIGMDTQRLLTDLGALAAETRRESDLLANLRDALLPQLMSGNIRVKDVENTVGEVL